ncbi:MAG: aromatic amino acid transport family protein [Parachlamydiaceae bacterium]|nr:aromatic amino acid transport family protein [Parachlamydiaceae bacterium]
MNKSSGSLLGGSFLIAGTTIGGGMLALPVTTSQVGFIPAVIIFFICWLFMASTGLLFLEISQWMKREANIVTMAEGTLGQIGKWIAWVVYLFLFYCLTVAYIVGCGNILVEMSGSQISDWLAPIIFVILFAPLIMIPTVLASRLNILLVIGLALSYFGFVFLGFSHVKADLLLTHDWSYAMYTLPISFVAFAYQGIIPTLFTYMHHDVAKTRKAILIGSFIPLIAYIIWEWLILGIVPFDGPQGLKDALMAGHNAVYPLKFFLKNNFIYLLGQSFAFFALVTSFLGVSLGLRDFLADGLKIKKNLKGKLTLALLVFFIPLMIAVTYPHIFLISLDYAGGFGSAILLGLLPILMVWSGRYRQHLSPNKPQLPGGKGLLIGLGIFVTVEIISESIHVFFM